MRLPVFDRRYPELLSLYADSIRQLAVRDKSLAAFREYYAWKGEACFVDGDYDAGFRWKRKALDLAVRGRMQDKVVTYSSDMGYYFNVSARYDSARFYLKKEWKQPGTSHAWLKTIG